MNRQRESGFTLLELMITLLVVGVVLTVGIPNMTAFSAGNRMTGAVNSLHSTFQLARSEAARSKSNVTICASTNSLAGAAANCGGTLEDGLIVFVDTDGDIVRDAGEAVIRGVPPLPDDISVTAGGTYFSFAPTGLGRGDVAGPAIQTAVLCDDRGNVHAGGGYSAARALVVTPIGRATVLREVAQVAAQGGCP